MIATIAPGKKRGTVTPNFPTSIRPSFLGCPTMVLCLTSACTSLHHNKWPCSPFSLSQKITSLSIPEMVSKAILYVGESIQSIHKNENFCFWQLWIEWDWICLSNVNIITGKLDKYVKNCLQLLDLKEAQNVVPEKGGTFAVSSTVIPSFNLKAHSRPAEQ